MTDNVSAEELEQRVLGALNDINRDYRDHLYRLLSQHVAKRTELTAREVDNLCAVVSSSGLITSQAMVIAYEQVATAHEVPEGKRNIETGFFSDTLPNVELRSDYLAAVKTAIEKASPLAYGPKAPPLLQFIRSSTAA